MNVDGFTPTGGRDLGPLIRQLQELGGNLVFVQWSEDPGTMAVQLHVPDDEEAAEKCRDLCRNYGSVD